MSGSTGMVARATSLVCRDIGVCMFHGRLIIGGPSESTSPRPTTSLRVPQPYHLRTLSATIPDAGGAFLDSEYIILL